MSRVSVPGWPGWHAVLRMEPDRDGPGRRLSVTVVAAAPAGAVSLTVWRSSDGLWYGKGGGLSRGPREPLSGPSSLAGAPLPAGVVDAVCALLSDPDGLVLSLEVMDS